MEFLKVNEWFWSLHPALHLLAFAIMVGLYTHLLFGFWMVQNKLPRHVIKYFLARTAVVISLLFIKEDLMLDLFFPLFLLSYLDGLIILNGFGLYRCQDMRQAFKKVSTFQSKKL